MIRGAWIFAVLSLLVVGLPASAAAQTSPPVTVEAVAPTEDGAVFVQRSAGPVAGQPDGWRVNMNVSLQNAGSEDLVLEQVRIAYTGGSNPADLVVTTHPAAVMPWVIPRDPRDPDDDADADEVLPAETILAERSRTAFVPEDRILPFPLPDQVTVEFTFADFDLPVVVDQALIEYVPPGGVTAFPFAAKDLEDGEYIGTGQNHRFGSAHRLSSTQQLGEDFNVSRWADGQWVTRDGPADENESAFVWGKPVYAIADGTVVRCFRGVPDNTPPDKHPDLFLDEDDPDKMPGGGNMFWIQHGSGEFTLYAHFQDGSIPDELCPDAEDDKGLKYPPGVPGAQVKAGQFLGEVGNSGSSSGPHLHIHTQQGHRDFGGGGSARPLVYDNVRVVDRATFDPDEGDPPWRQVNGAAVTVSGAVVGSFKFGGVTFGGTQIGGFAGYGTVDRMLIDPLPLINLELTKTDDVGPDAAVAGTEFSYTLTVVNHGPESAPNVAIIDQLPPELEYVSDDGGCALEPGALVCPVGGLGVGEQSAPITITVAVPHDLVHNNGGPLTVTNTAVAVSFFGPSEATWEDNQAEEATFVIAKADLEVVSFEVIDPPPAQLLVGEEVAVTLRTTIANHGPSWPMDVNVHTFPVLPNGFDVTPLGVTAVADAVEHGELREVDEAFSLTCQEPGLQQLTFLVQIAPDDVSDIDPDGSNNAAEVAVAVDCVVPVALNIRPGSEHNHVNPDSGGVVRAAVLTTEVGEYGLPIGFDAARIVPETVRFGHPDLVWTETGGAPAHGDARIRDAHELDDKTKDGDDDLILRFASPETGIEPGDTEACIKGLYEEGGQQFAFFGCDMVDTVPPG